MGRPAKTIDVTSVSLNTEVRNHLSSFQRENEGVLDSIITMEYNDQSDFDFAGDLLQDILSGKKYLKGELEKITKPLKQVEKAARALFKEPIQYYDLCENALRAGIAAGYARIEAEQQRKLHAAAQASLHGDVAGAREEIAAVQDMAIGDIHGLSMLEQWTYEVVDVDLVPLEFITKSVNDAAVRAVMELGRKDIPGLHIFSLKKVRAKPLKNT
jgi:hypothetical protein